MKKDHVKPGSLSSRLKESIELSPATFSELNESFDEDRRRIASKAKSLCDRRFICRTPFSTSEGRIYGREMKEAVDHGIKKGLIPAGFYELGKAIDSCGAVSTLELRADGFDASDVSWFRSKLCRSGMLKREYFDNCEVFFRDRGRADSWWEANKEKVGKLKSDFKSRIKRQGQELEKHIGDYYERLGFRVERNRFFTTPSGEKFEIDLLATKPEIDLVIAVECKNYTAMTLSGNQWLKTYSRIKAVFPGAVIHIYARSVSHYLFENRSMWRQFSDVRLFTGKKLRAAEKLIVVR